MTNKPKAFQLEKKDIKQASFTLHQAFRYDPLMLWIFGSESDYLSMGQSVIETWVRYCVLYGVAYRTENFEAVALRKKPRDLETSFWRLIRSGMIKTPKIISKSAFDRLMIFDKLSDQIKKSTMENKPFLYCWMIGTIPNFQKQGFAAALMDETFNYAKQCSVPCYLEVASEQSRAVHIKKGYKLLSEFTVPQSEITVSVMVN